MGEVVIGIDPHKASHTAVAVDERESVLGQLRVSASSRQTRDLPVLDDIVIGSRVDQARMELARELLADMRRINEQRRDNRRRLAKAVTASSTTLTDITGVGPIVAATVLGVVGDVHRFPTRDHFAAFNGTVPIEASSGPRVIHIAAVSQLRYPGPGRDYDNRKRSEGMPGKTALRTLKRPVCETWPHASWLPTYEGSGR